jgi:hypothetical protein
MDIHDDFKSPEFFRGLFYAHGHVMNFAAWQQHMPGAASRRKSSCPTSSKFVSWNSERKGEKPWTTQQL